VKNFVENGRISPNAVQLGKLSTNAVCLAKILTCPDCGARMVLRDSKYGKFYGCSTFPKCRSAHRAHPDGRPLGIPANKETKNWRIRAHAAFDQLWLLGGMNRRSAYLWMQKALNLTSKEAHIGMFDQAMCEKLIAAVEKELEKKP